MSKQVCADCGSDDIDIDSSCMGVYRCNVCKSTNIRWI